ncbi:MAG: hypothetical protein LIP28_01370 [Deltaproteobacteria bacterium]|nr:hypothetical protein [Deltaproteobacteria bacterium]
MPSASQPLSERLARQVRAWLVRLDTRVLVGFVSAAGLLAWIMPWPVTVFFFAVACVFAFTAAVELRDGRAALTAYGVFVLVWTVSQLALFLLEHPGQFREATIQAALLGGRLFVLLGLALAVPLAATPLMLARTLTWYLGWLVGAEKWVCFTLFRRKITPVLAGGVWRAALALCLMMAFFPRSMRSMKELRRSLLMRAPRLPLYKRAGFMGLAVLRVVSSQTWDMTLAIASRNLYRPEPWEWPR